LVASVVPTAPKLAPGHLDKVAHLCEYLLFAWLIMQALSMNAHLRMRAWLYATGYGLFMELIQSWLPWRSAELGDALANALGAAVGVWLAARLASVTHHSPLVTNH